VYLSLAFVTGVYVGSHVGLPWTIAVPVAATAVLAALMLRRRRFLTMAALCLAVFVCGVIRFGAVPSGDDVQAYVDQGPVEVVGMVAEVPEPRDSSLSFVLAVEQVDGTAARGNLLVLTTRYPGYEYGDVLKLTGEVSEPVGDLDGFDYRAYLSRQGIYTTMGHPFVEVVATGRGPQPLQSVYWLRHRMGEALATSLAEPEASLAQGMLLGLRHDIPSSLYDDFRRSGTAHLLAISGLHMAIVSGIILAVSVWLFGRHRPAYFIVTLVVLWAYALLAGMSPSVVRAAIMVSIFLLGAYLGRQRSAITAVAFAAAIMVAVNPRVLWSVSFQLSFAAVAGVVLLGPSLQEWARKTRAPTILVDSFSYSLAAILTTLPVVAYYFGYVSLVGMPATFLAVFALPGAIVLSAVTGLLGIFALPAAQVIGCVDWLFLKYVVVVVQGFASLPYSSLELGYMDVAWVCLYYGVLGGAMLALGRRRAA
ncbi:MAG: ComEC/Rec2 family competence protein, partial [Chloroflexota bacterium]